MWKVMRFLTILSLVATAPSEKQAFEGVNTFALQLLNNAYAYQENFDSNNFAISPISVWSAFALLAEGSTGDTFRELMSVLKLPDDLKATQALHLAVKALQKSDKEVTLKGQASIFADRTLHIHQEFCEAATLYKTDIFSVDTRNTTRLAEDINYFICQATEGWIRDAVKPKFLEKLRMILVDALYFKANWTKPFDVTQTKKDDFYNSMGKTIGSVNMMYQKAKFQLEDVSSIGAQVIELPYGMKEEYSMFVILPFTGMPLKTLLDNLSSKPLGWLTTFSQEDGEDEDTEADVFIPRFKISSQLDLIPPMQYTGIYSIFDETKAELPGISNEPLYVSKTIQNVEIDVNEEGTVAAAATVIGIEDRILPPRFEANREFVFLITEKRSNVILFAGVYKNPVLV